MLHNLDESLSVWVQETCVYLILAMMARGARLEVAVLLGDHTLREEAEEEEEEDRWVLSDVL